MTQTRPLRYRPLQVSLHWLIVVLVTAAFVLGKIMTGMPNDAAKLPYLAVHMSIGLMTLLVMVVRFIARMRLPQPAPATTGHRLLDWLGPAVHYLLYALILLMAISGTSLSLQAGLLPIVFGGSGAALPPDLFVFQARAFHGLLSRLLLVTVALHVAASLYHQFVLNDKLLSRMWFRRAV